MEDRETDSFQLKGFLSRKNRLDPGDIMKSKIKLREAGYYDFPEDGPDAYPEDQMFGSIENFQKDKDLRVDGTMKPKGETERELDKALHPEGPLTTSQKELPPKPKCRDGYYPALQSIGIPGTRLYYYWWKCMIMPRGGGVKG